MIKIVVLGSSGQLGSELRSLSLNYPYKFLFFDSKSLDITNEEAIYTMLEEEKPHILINCAAYTAVDKAESEGEKAFSINTKGVQYIAESCSKGDVHFIHVSTDFVYTGVGTTPFKEDDEKGNLSVYSNSKLAGEQAIIDSDCNYNIFRVSWLYSSFGNNFVKTMRRLGTEKDELNVVNDQIGNPTYAYDFAKFLLENIKKIPNHNKEIYNYSNLGEISWYDFAVEIMSQSKLECKVNPIPTAQYPTPANRPQYSALDKSKIIKDFNCIIPHWKESLKECLQKL